MAKDNWAKHSSARTERKNKQYENNCITFGKYCGKHIKDIPHDYLEWLLKSGAGLAWEEIIKKELGKR